MEQQGKSDLYPNYQELAGAISLPKDGVPAPFTVKLAFGILLLLSPGTV